MRNPVQITLSLVTSTALLFTGCVETIPDTRRSRDATSSEVDGPQQQVAGYVSPWDTTEYSPTPRAGWRPVYYPLYMGGSAFYDNRGRYHASGASRQLIDQSGGYRPLAGGAAAAAATERPSRAAAPSARQRSSARGGFGSSAAGRSAGA